ncbi:hypothetical protein HanRHA438_Chr10g0451081 [Helianthus annuus]|nr:hypothetical protein HanIR_Chr10g0473221 [Helianthus annuus]KAJ0879406.1 hypothetical protein HanRHA438_Chr10g0451081 [Helianthus annuus]
MLIWKTRAHHDRVLQLFMLCYKLHVDREMFTHLSQISAKILHFMRLGLRLWSYVREEASHGRVISQGALNGWILMQI